MNLSQLKEDEVHDLVLTVSSAPGGDSEGSEVRSEYYRGTIQCLLQICSTNVEEESEAKPIDMKPIARRYVSIHTLHVWTCTCTCMCVTHTCVYMYNGLIAWPDQRTTLRGYYL